MIKRNVFVMIPVVAFACCCALFVAGRTRAASDLTPKQARRLIASIAGIQLPSDAVRIKEISAFGNSAVVVAQVETAFRLVKGDQDKWRVAEIRTGDRRWEDVELLIKALDVEKTGRARAELQSIATALESYRRERGFYVESESASVLVDQLSPRYLTQVVRVDPWHQPYLYEGTRTGFILRSAGPDGKPNTPDDVMFTNGTH